MGKKEPDATSSVRNKKRRLKGTGKRGDKGMKRALGIMGLSGCLGAEGEMGGGTDCRMGGGCWRWGWEGTTQDTAERFLLRTKSRLQISHD